MRKYDASRLNIIAEVRIEDCQSKPVYRLSCYSSGAEETSGTVYTKRMKNVRLCVQELALKGMTPVSDIELEHDRMYKTLEKPRFRLLKDGRAMLGRIPCGRKRRVNAEEDTYLVWSIIDFSGLSTPIDNAGMQKGW